MLHHRTDKFRLHSAGIPAIPAVIAAPDDKAKGHGGTGFVPGYVGESGPLIQLDLSVFRQDKGSAAVDLALEVVQGRCAVVCELGADSGKVAAVRPEDLLAQAVGQGKQLHGGGPRFISTHELLQHPVLKGA